MKKNKTKDTVTAPVDRVLYSIIKINMQLYRLVKLTIRDDGTYEQVVMHEDIPPICYGKLLQAIQAQGFNPNV